MNAGNDFEHDGKSAVNFGRDRGEKAPILGLRAFISHTKSIPMFL
jgi:hypothetical protein